MRRRTFPARPAGYLEPRATLESFIRHTSEGVDAYRRGEDPDRVVAIFARAERCLDLSGISRDLAHSAAVENGLLLYEVLNRAGVPPPEEVPDAVAMEQQERSRWVVPETEIAIVRIDEGERAGEYLFSADTVRRLPEFYARVRHLGHRTGYSPGNYEDFVNRSDIHWPHQWVDGLPSWAKARLWRNPLWKWLALALALVIMPLLFAYLAEQVIALRFGALALVLKAFYALGFVAAVFALFALAEFITDLIVSSRRLKVRSVDAHFTRVMLRILAVVAGIGLILMAADFLGVQLTPVLAGLGIGGLTLFVDKPVRVGDYCRFGDEEGTVEEIGLRSTRIRKRDETLVSIPNSDFSQMKLQNNDRRRRWLYRPTIGLRYETTPEQMRYVLAKLREMLIGHPKVYGDRLFVRFQGFGDYSLDVEIFAYIRTREWLTYLAIREDINLRVMDVVKQAGTGFAFPSQTAYLARDGGLDSASRQEAEARVAAWRREGRLPFPDIDPGREAELRDRLDYPPTGAPSRPDQA